MKHTQQRAFAEKAAAIKAEADPANSFAGAPENMKPREAALYLNLSESYLAKTRMVSDPRAGPPFARVGKAIIYRRVDLDEWLVSRIAKAA